MMRRLFSILNNRGAITRRGVIAGAFLTVAVVGIVGALVVVSGLMPITASSGHWAVTEWFLHFTMRRSVATHSLGIHAPPLDKPDLVLKGATHYEVGCRSCHGSPGMNRPRIPQAMTPHPPELAPRVAELTPEELFYVVKHGVKFTGMPAWPANNRDDEVWSIVAFLVKLPGLDEAAYHRLIHGEPPQTAPIEALGGTPRVPDSLIASCVRCHGRDGLGRQSTVFPKLAGQRREYLEQALLAYAEGKRHSGIMEPVAAGLTASAIKVLSAYYSSLPASSHATSKERDEAAIARGREIAQGGIPDRRVASCADCHEQSGPHHKPAYPILAGQPADYLVLQLELFQKNHRGGSEYTHLMHSVAPRLTPQQVRDVALYFESLAPLPSE